MSVKPLERYTQDIVVEIKAQTGVNSHNYPIYATSTTTVKDCLVSPQQPVDLLGGKFEATRYEGHMGRLFIWIPKTCTLEFENARVLVNDIWYKVKGRPSRYNETPPGIRWNLYLIVESESG